ncbi:MAG: HD domain-containing protein [Desulfobacteraceae bacterium]|nr:HD domain-containing protein [Desulfobacteraceae bacterium]
MKTPTRTECLRLLHDYGMPGNILRHSLMVAEVALFLGLKLNMNSLRLDLKLVEAAALLHDVGKERGLRTGGDHAALGAGMIEGVVPAAVADIVREHVFLSPSQLEGPITESLLVNYADKRVMHDRIVSVEARYHDLISRYAKSESHARNLLDKLRLYTALEGSIFSHLNIEPMGAEITGLTIEDIKGAEPGPHGKEETHSGFAGGWEVR